MEKFLIVLCCVVLAILLIIGGVSIYQSIASSSVKEGVIVNKEFIPEHTTMIPITTYITAGNVKVPNTTHVIRHYSDQWTIVFEGKNNLGKVCQRTVYVSEEVYNSYKINDMFIYDKAICSDEEHYVDEE
jgi:hypothetical protein